MQSGPFGKDTSFKVPGNDNPLFLLMRIGYLLQVLQQRQFRPDGRNQKQVGSFEMWCWRRMEKISWTDRVRNEEVLLIVNEQRNILHEIRKRKLIGLVTSYVETAF